MNKFNVGDIIVYINIVYVVLHIDIKNRLISLSCINNRVFFITHKLDEGLVIKDIKGKLSKHQPIIL